MPKKKKLRDPTVLSKADERALLDIEKIKMKRIQQEEEKKIELERKKLRSAKKREKLREELDNRKVQLSIKSPEFNVAFSEPDRKYILHIRQLFSK